MVGTVLPDVELFEDVQTDKDETGFAAETIPLKMKSEPDKRDKPFDMPDHVITPTLADLYFQQGQHTLALQLYSRLLKREPDNEKIAERIKEIQSIIAASPSQEIVSETTKTSDTTDRQTEKKPHKKRKSSSRNVPDIRPLAGVRIKKRNKYARKNSRKTK